MTVVVGDVSSRNESFGEIAGVPAAVARGIRSAAWQSGRGPDLRARPTQKDDQEAYESGGHHQRRESALFFRTPWSTDAIMYLAGLLKEELTNAEMIQIAQVAVLPRDNEWIISLRRNGRQPTCKVRGLRELCDEALVIWPAGDPPQMAGVN